MTDRPKFTRPPRLVPSYDPPPLTPEQERISQIPTIPLDPTARRRANTGTLRQFVETVRDAREAIERIIGGNPPPLTDDKRLYPHGRD